MSDRREFLKQMALIPFIGKSLFGSMLKNPPMASVSPNDLIATARIQNKEMSVFMAVKIYGISVTDDLITDPICEEMGGTERYVVGRKLTLEFEVKDRKTFTKILDKTDPNTYYHIRFDPDGPRKLLGERLTMPKVRITHGQVVPIIGKKGFARHIIEGLIYPDEYAKLWSIGK